MASSSIVYEGVGPEKGKRVHLEDAFSYACERCLSGSPQEQAEFMAIAKETKDILGFALELVEWFYSGNWVKVKVKEDPYGNVI